MQSFDIVDEKLAEADFLCDRIANAGFDFYRARFMFSAFVGASRSVTFALQGALRGAPGFDAWYLKRQAVLKANHLARFFHECRTDNQHLDLNLVVGGFGGPESGSFVFGQPEAERYKCIPDDDALTACRRHRRLLRTIIDECYRDFGLVIDPEQIYSLNGLRELGLTVEDVEEELGFPRGYTDIEWSADDKEERRLEALRCHIPISRIKATLEKYLGDPELE